MQKKLFNSFAEALLSSVEGRKLFYRSKRKIKRQRKKEKHKEKDQMKKYGFTPMEFWIE